MKISMITIGLLLSYLGSSQNTTISYTPSTAAISNPERGFYRHTEVHSSSYSSLNQSTLNGYSASNTTLVLRVFYLENFITSPISSAYLNSMQSDFDKIRNAGLKCIVRFAYSDNINGALDASKSQILAHILQIKPLLIANEDIIAFMQAGFIGSWGEWYYTDHFGMSPTPTDYANRKEVLDAILAALPSSRMVQIRTPLLKQKTFLTTTPLAASQAYNGSNIARVGHHNDCFLASSSDFGTYSNTASEYAYLEQETKYTPMGGETCAVNIPRSECPTAVYELQKFHWTYMNLDYNASVISGFQSGNCFSDIKNKLGYRYELVNGVYPQFANSGTTMPITFKIKNSGYATLVNPRTVYLVLRNTMNNQEYTLTMATNPRFWSSGIETTITENIALPAGMVSGSYRLFLKLPDANSTLSTRPEYSIQLANVGTWESTTGYNNLNHIVKVDSSLGVNDSEKIQWVAYPIPTKDELILEGNDIENYNWTVYSSLGQKMKVSSRLDTNKISISTQNLSNGIYFIQLEKNETKETIKFIVSR